MRGSWLLVRREPSGCADHMGETAYVARGGFGDWWVRAGNHGSSHDVTHHGAQEHHYRGVGIRVIAGEPRHLEAPDIGAKFIVRVVSPFAGKPRGLGPFVHLAGGMHKQGPHCAKLVQRRADIRREFGLGVDGSFRQRGDGELFVAVCEHSLEQCALGAERAKQGDFVDACFDGDEARRRAPETVLGIHTRRGFENSFARDHGADSSGNMRVCKYLLACYGGDIPNITRNQLARNTPFEVLRFDLLARHGDLVVIVDVVHRSLTSGRMASPHTLVSSSSSLRRGAAYLVAPRKRHRRSWLQRQLASRRGRFELAIIGGGALALALASLLPGMMDAPALSLLVVAACAMTVVDSFVGVVPSLVATIFAPLVVALTDPMWTLGNTLNDFTLGKETSGTFLVFVSAAALGALIRQWRRHHRPAEPRALWRAVPR